MNVTASCGWCSYGTWPGTARKWCLQGQVRSLVQRATRQKSRIKRLELVLVKVHGQNMVPHEVMPARSRKVNSIKRSLLQRSIVRKSTVWRSTVWRSIIQCQLNSIVFVHINSIINTLFLLRNNESKIMFSLLLFEPGHFAYCLFSLVKPVFPRDALDFLT